MSSMDQCVDRYCSDCSTLCNHRLILCDTCDEPMEVRVRGRFPRVGYIDGEKFTFPCDPSALLREASAPMDLFTFLVRPGSSQRYSYPSEPDNLAVLSISTFDNWWTKQIDGKTRNAARKAEKAGVEVCEVPFTGELVRAICEIYNETPIRQGKKFQHYGMTYQQAAKYAGTFPGQGIFIAAKFDGKIIGFAKLITNHARDFACVVHFTAMIQHRDKSINNALVAGAVKACAERGVTQLAYDNFSYGKKERDSLSDFKLNNGFEKVDIRRYYVPITAVGSVAFRLGLHRSLSERIPEVVSSRLRKLRADWYARSLAH